RLDLVARDARQRHSPRRRGRLARRREEGVEVGTEATQLPPALADHRQQLGTRRADPFQRGLRVEEYLERLLDARVVRHGASPPDDEATSSRNAFGRLYGG